MDAATLMTTLYSVQSILSALTALDLTGYLFPPAATVLNGTAFDFIIVGGGTAGAVIAEGLTNNTSYNVLLVEAGGDPPLEALLGGLFPYIPNSSVDWNLFSEDDGYSSQYHKNRVTGLTAGKMLGGSGALDHLLHVRGKPADFEEWAAAANDSSWGWDGLYPYFLKSEHLEDPEILQSSSAENYGVYGNIGITRQLHDEVLPIFNALKELGNEILLDINENRTMGYGQPIIRVTNNIRQTTAVTYLGKAKGRSNLFVLKKTVATKILFENTTAIGIEAVTSSNETLTLMANKEVIVSAGALNSPKLLLLSGVGSKESLEDLGIDVVSDIASVGQNLQDHISVQIFHTLEESNATASAVNPADFPIPSFIGYKALNSSQTFPDYQAIGLVFPHDSSSSLALCSNVFTYEDDICNTIYNASIGKNLLWTVHNIMHPVSRGSLKLKSSDPSDPPVVVHGAFSNEADLINEAAYVADYAQLVNTTYFKSIGSEIVKFDLPECPDLEFGTTEYWQCYTLHMMGTMFHYAGTCSLGTVVDERLRVNGVSNLRIADGSVMPYITSGNIMEPIVAIAQKAIDLILADNA